MAGKIIVQCISISEFLALFFTLLFQYFHLSQEGIVADEMT
jgi:hypothetical protein